MLCNKISENPRKGFLQLLARGMNKIKKRIYFEPYVTQVFFAPGNGMFHGKKCILGHPNVQCIRTLKKKNYESQIEEFNRFRRGFFLQILRNVQLR